MVEKRPDLEEKWNNQKINFLKTLELQWPDKSKIDQNQPYSIKTNFALGIEVEILFTRNEQKDCSGKPDPQGNAQKRLKMVRKNKLDGSLNTMKGDLKSRFIV